jgi:hypothetical protein
MEQQATLEYTLPLLREAVAGFWRRSVGLGFLVALALCVVVLCVLLIQGDRSWAVGFIAAVLLFGLLFIAAVYFVHYRNALQKFQNMGAPTATLRVSQDSFTVTSGAGSSTLPWTSVTEVWKLQNVWLLLFSKAQFMTLPLKSIPKDMRAFVLERISSAGGKTDG